MLTREEFIQDRERVFDKVYGALSGLAIGDSFGDASRKQENRANYAITTDFNKGASWSTDDTEFALLTAKTLIRCGGKLTTEECVRSWMEDVVTQDEYKRGGASEIEAANNLRKGLLPPLSGKFNAFHMSDGSSMRIGPIGIICAGDPEKAKEYARIESEVSHYRDGVWGAQAVAAAVAVAMVDGSIDEIMMAYQTKQIHLHSRIAIPARSLGKTSFTPKQMNQYLMTTVGKVIFNNMFPEDFPFLNEVSNENFKATPDKFFLNMGENIHDAIVNLPITPAFKKKDLGKIIGEIFKALLNGKDITDPR